MKKLLLTLFCLPMLGFGQTTIWSDDCSSASTWVFTNSSTLNINWAIEMDPNATPAGGNLTPMASASAANGYMMVSSDADGGPDGDGTTISTEFTNATPIDLTLYPNVQLTFQHNFRWWDDTRIVRISPDNGLTWVEIDEITNYWSYTYPNQSSDNPHMSTYDISAVAGGQSQVLVQFYYNDNDIWAWYWAVDDIAISELPDNLVVSSEEVMGGWWIGYQTTGGLGQDYTFNPISQATANPYAFEAVLSNDGVGTQDVTMHVEVTEDASGSNVLSTTSNVLTLAAGEQDTVAANATFTPANTGLYTIDMWSVADSAGLGNTITYTDTTTKMTMVTDYIYGKDYGQADGYWRLNSASGFGFEISSTFDMYANANLYSVDAHISDWSIVGSVVYATLYEEDIWGDPIFLDQSDPYTITQYDLGNWINVDFLSSQSLIAGTGYRIAIGADMHPTDTVGINLSGNGEYSSQGLYDKDDYYGSWGGPTWYTISDIPMLRMNFDPASVASYGCTDPLATNYDPTATVDDGSCVYCTSLSLNINHINISCNGMNDGSATVIPSGGVVPYTYWWSNGQTTATALGLIAGTYSCTVMDANGCQVSSSVNVIEPSALISTIQQNSVSCFGGNDGSATVIPSGGVVPYTYWWSNGQTTATALGLIAGAYSVEIYDANNCLLNMSDSITEPSEILTNISVTSCDTYTWYGVTYTTSGTYSNTYTNSVGCDSLVTLDLIIVNNPITSQILGGTQLIINSSDTYVVSQTLNSTYDWGVLNNGGVILSGLPTNSVQVQWGSQIGTFDVFVIETDANGCVGDTVFLTVTLNNSTGLEEFKITDLIIYPNPSRDLFNISFTSETVQDLKIRILNVVGEVIISEDLDQFIGEYTKQINLHENAKGIYFLEIETNDGVVNKKLILQ